MRDNLIIYMDRVTPAFWEGTSTYLDGRYVPARPKGFSSFWYRVRATWLVWSGRADALVWPGGQ
jgi:hypothetical protein